MFDFILILCSLLSLGLALWVLVRPLFLQPQAPYFTSEPSPPAVDEEVILLDTISELETDYKMGKLTQAEFEELSLEYKHKYLDLKSNSPSGP